MLIPGIAVAGAVGAPSRFLLDGYVQEHTAWRSSLAELPSPMMLRVGRDPVEKRAGIEWAERPDPVSEGRHTAQVHAIPGRVGCKQRDRGGSAPFSSLRVH
jgi:hypothetical protein